MVRNDHYTGILLAGLSKYRQFKSRKFTYHRAYTHEGAARHAAIYLRKKGFKVRVVSINKQSWGRRYRWAIYINR